MAYFDSSGRYGAKTPQEAARMAEQGLWAVPAGAGLRGLYFGIKPGLAGLKAAPKYLKNKVKYSSSAVDPAGPVQPSVRPIYENTANILRGVGKRIKYDPKTIGPRGGMGNAQIRPSYAKAQEILSNLGNFGGNIGNYGRNIGNYGRNVWRSPNNPIPNNPIPTAVALGMGAASTAVPWGSSSSGTTTAASADTPTTVPTSNNPQLDGLALKTSSLKGIPGYMPTTGDMYSDMVIPAVQQTPVTAKQIPVNTRQAQPTPSSYVPLP